VRWDEAEQNFGCQGKSATGATRVSGRDFISGLFEKNKKEVTGLCKIYAGIYMDDILDIIEIIRNGSKNGKKRQEDTGGRKRKLSLPEAR